MCKGTRQNASQAKYNCEWCGESCQYKNACRSQPTANCPSPVIEQVYILTGTVKQQSISCNMCKSLKQKKDKDCVVFSLVSETEFNLHIMQLLIVCMCSSIDGQKFFVIPFNANAKGYYNCMQQQQSLSTIPFHPGYTTHCTYRRCYVHHHQRHQPRLELSRCTQRDAGRYTVYSSRRYL